MQLIKTIYILLLMAPSMKATISQIELKNDSVLVCYGKLAPEVINGYKYVILEDKHYSKTDINTIKSQNKKVFAYISLGEVNQYADHYEVLKNSALGKNKIWNSYYLNLASEKTISVLMTIVDALFQKGYHGLFLDNIDNFSTFGEQKRQKNELIALLKKMKLAHPKKEFIQNAGLDLVGETYKYVNCIAIESIASDYLFENKTYNLRNAKEYSDGIERLIAINKTYQIPIILIEYADTKKLYDQIKIRIDTTTFDSFIGTIDLQHLPVLKK